MLAPLLVLAALPPPPPLPEPAPLTREDRRERGTSPGYFFHHRGHTRVGGRFGMGLDGRLHGPLRVPATLALDAVAVLRVPASRRHPRFTLFPELGYSFAAGAKDTRAHLFTAGFGLGGTEAGTGVAFIPRFVAGSVLGQRALGVRAGFLVERVRDGGGGLEFAYQAVVLPDAAIHTLHIVVFVGYYVPRAR